MLIELTFSVGEGLFFQFEGLVCFSLGTLLLINHSFELAFFLLKSLLLHHHFSFNSACILDGPIQLGL